MRRSITGTATSTSAALRRDRGEGLFRIELACEHHGVAEQQARRRVRESPRMEARCRDDHLLVGAVGESFEQRDRGAGMRRAGDERALGRTGGAGSQDDRPARALGTDEARTVGVPGRDRVHRLRLAFGPASFGPASFGPASFGWTSSVQARRRGSGRWVSSGANSASCTRSVALLPAGAPCRSAAPRRRC